jgi:uncharacterized protein
MNLPLESVRAIAAAHDVQRLELFGSTARGEVGRDFDFLVTFKPMPPLEHGRAYFALLANLEASLGRKVDLLELEAIRNPFFLAAIAADRALIYGA